MPTCTWNVPTHSLSSILDLFICDDSLNVFDLAVVDVGMSDIFLLLVKLPLRQNLSPELQRLQEAWPQCSLYHLVLKPSTFGHLTSG